MSCCHKEHLHDDGHDHHNHSHRFSLIFYFVGLALFISTFLIENYLVNTIIHLTSMILSGYDVIFEGIKDTIVESKKNKRIQLNIHILMALAAIFAIIIKQYGEASLLILIFAGARFLEEYAQEKSKKDIKDLLSLAPNEARLINQNIETIVNVETLKIGDNIVVLPGEKIPIDGILTSDIAYIDEKTMTGESVPVEKKSGEMLLASTINLSTKINLTVSKTHDETVLSQMIEMIKTTTKDESKTTLLIKKIEPIYVNIVVILMPIYYLINYYLLQMNVHDSFYKTANFLIAASPCALAATSIPATISAISNLSRQGILFKGGEYVANMASIKMIAFDKTGTITKGVLNVKEVIYLNDENKDFNHKMISALEKHANHPIAQALLEYFGESNLIIEVENIIGYGLTTNYNDTIYKIGKLDNENTNILLEKNLVTPISTLVGYYVNDQLEVVISLIDEVKEESKEIINYFKVNNIKTALISGDNDKVTSNIKETLDIDYAYANQTPVDKAITIENLKKEYDSILFVGDGINDSVALKSSTIGISVGNGADIAIESSDAVLVKNNLSKITYAHKLSLKLKRILIQNVIIAMGVVFVLITTNIFVHIDMPITVIFHEGSTVLVILNGLRMLLPLKNK